MANAQGKELDWNAPIENDGGGFELLPPGDYHFRVIAMTRKRFGGSAKLPPCNQAVVELEIDGVTISHSLFLHTKTEGLLCAFFVGIGARQHGQRVSMDWNAIIGKTGTCKVAIRTWYKKEDKERKDPQESNEIKKFYDPSDAPAIGAPAVPDPAPPVATAPVAQVPAEVDDDIPF